MDKFTGMINPQELRIGIYFRDPETKQIGRITRENVFSALALILDYGGAEGVPLTPEIIEKAGFILLEDHYILPSEESEPEEDYYANKVDFAIGVTGEGYRVWNGCGHTEYAIGRTFQYVHELQNLFRSLTGEELSITL
jgi:hypothetical protein